MAFLSTQGSFYQPDAGRYSDYSPAKVMWVQTAGSLALTAGSVGIFQSASTAKLGCGANQFHLVSLVVSTYLPSTTAEVFAYAGKSIIGRIATGTAGIISANFGPNGIVVPEVVTTSTVSVISNVGGASGYFMALGYYEI